MQPWLGALQHLLSSSEQPGGTIWSRDSEEEFWPGRGGHTALPAALPWLLQERSHPRSLQERRHLDGVGVVGWRKLQRAQGWHGLSGPGVALARGEHPAVSPCPHPAEPPLSQSEPPPPEPGTTDWAEGHAHSWPGMQRASSSSSSSSSSCSAGGGFPRAGSWQEFWQEQRVSLQLGEAHGNAPGASLQPIRAPAQRT